LSVGKRDESNCERYLLSKIDQSRGHSENRQNCHSIDKEILEMSNRTKKKYIYIMGCGRSGTTILDIILGNANKCFSLGELTRYPLYRGEPSVWNYHKKHKNWVFWSKVKKRIDSSECIDYENLASIFKKMEWHDAFFKRIFLSKSKKKVYHDFNTKLLKTIYDISKVDVLIDSSKYPMRAYSLSTFIPYDITYIYARRKLKDVIKSFKKPNWLGIKKNFFQTVVYYGFVNLLSIATVVLLKRKGFKVLFWEYEHFVNEPEKIIIWLTEELGLDIKDLREKLKNGFKVGSLFAGNHVRLNKIVRIHKQ